MSTKAVLRVLLLALYPVLAIVMLLNTGSYWLIIPSAGLVWLPGGVYNILKLKNANGNAYFNLSSSLYHVWVKAGENPDYKYMNVSKLKSVVFSIHLQQFMFILGFFLAAINPLWVLVSLVAALSFPTTTARYRLRHYAEAGRLGNAAEGEDLEDLFKPFIKEF